MRGKEIEKGGKVVGWGMRERGLLEVESSLLYPTILARLEMTNSENYPTKNIYLAGGYILWGRTTPIGWTNSLLSNSLSRNQAS